MNIHDAHPSIRWAVGIASYFFFVFALCLIGTGLFLIVINIPDLLLLMNAPRDQNNEFGWFYLFALLIVAGLLFAVLAWKAIQACGMNRLPWLPSNQPLHPDALTRAGERRR